MLQKYSLNSVSMAAVCAAVIFLVFFLIFIIGSEFGFLASFFLSLLIAVLSGIIIYLLFGHKVTGIAPAGTGHAATGGAAVASAGADTMATKQADETAGIAARKAAEAETARKAAEAAEAAEKAAAEADRVAAEAEKAAEADIAPESAATPDYDGDGKLEGTGEGTRPTGLDAPRDGQADDLKQIKGVGPKLEKLLNSMGFWHFDQVAAWSADEVAWVDANLTGFKGRVSRDNWMEQARLLASGGQTEFSKRVEDGDVY